MSIIRTRRPRALLFGLAAVTLALVLAGPWANAGGQFSVGNPSLEHFDSDGGVQLDFGLTDQGGAPVGNLRADNVQVLEDGKAARIIDFRGAGQGRPVDIVFVLDVTESMQPYIDAVKQNVIAFAQDLAANNRDYRLGLVTFEDYVVSKYPDCNCAYQEKMTFERQRVHRMGRQPARGRRRRHPGGPARCPGLCRKLSVPAGGAGRNHPGHRRAAASCR